MGKHKWRKPSNLIRWPYCSACGVIRRADGKNKPCRGTPKLALRADQARTRVLSDDETRGVLKRAMKKDPSLSTCRKHLRDLTCHECAAIRLRAEVRRLRKALRYFLACTPCKNGCPPGDMTCTSRRAEAALRQRPRR